MVESRDRENNFNQVLKQKRLDYFLGQEIKRALRYRLFFSLLITQPRITSISKGIKAKRRKKEIMDNIAHLIQKEIRSSDIIGWVDKDKLLILLLETPDHNALYVGKRLCNLIQNYNFGKEKVSLNMGAVCFPADGVYKQELVDKARRLLEQAKSEGENLVLLSET